MWVLVLPKGPTLIRHHHRHWKENRPQALKLICKEEIQEEEHSSTAVRNQFIRTKHVVHITREHTSLISTINPSDEQKPTNALPRLPAGVTRGARVCPKDIPIKVRRKTERAFPRLEPTLVRAQERSGWSAGASTKAGTTA